MCARLVPYCGQWCITWQLTDEALTFYSWPRGQFSGSWNCGGLHPLTLECSNELWPCGRILKRSRDSEPFKCGDESRMQIEGEREMDAPESKTPSWSFFRFPRTFHLILFCSPLRSLIVFTVHLLVRGLSVAYPQSVHTVLYSSFVSPQARKISQAKEV